MTGIMPLTRELGDILYCRPVPKIEQIAGPTRPSCGRWSPEQWAEMEKIYNTPDPFADRVEEGAKS